MLAKPRTSGIFAQDLGMYSADDRWVVHHWSQDY